MSHEIEAKPDDNPLVAFYRFSNSVPFVKKQNDDYVRIARQHARASKQDITVLCGGCGIGPNLKELSTDGSLRVVGLDINGDALKEAKSTAGGQRNVRLVVGDVTKLPFHDKTFDVYGLLNVVYFVSEPNRVFDEMARVLKPKGIFIISGAIPGYKSEPLIQAGLAYLDEINADQSLRESVHKFAAQQKQREKDVKNSSLFTLDQICHILENRLNFSIIESGPSFLGQHYFVVARK